VQYKFLKRWHVCSRIFTIYLLITFSLKEHLKLHVYSTFIQLPGDFIPRTRIMAPHLDPTGGLPSPKHPLVCSRIFKLFQAPTEMSNNSYIHHYYCYALLVLLVVLLSETSLVSRLVFTTVSTQIFHTIN